MKRRIEIAVLAALPAALILIIALKEPVFQLADRYGMCVFHMVTGLHCPGCGNTRSVKALLEGDLLLALRNNPAIPFIAAALGALYIEAAADVLGRPVKLLPRRMWIWWMILALFAAFYILRNFIPILAPII